MIKVQNGIATREPIPGFLQGLKPESLLDLAWTDPALGVQECAWWPSEEKIPALGEDQQYGAEVLVVDPVRRVVVVTKEVVYKQPALPTEAEYVAAVQAMLDAKAQERNYDSILSACTYAASTQPKFQAEGRACVAWRDAVWAKCYELMAAVKTGMLPQPTLSGLLSLLPTMEWPA